jgi:galactose mutarotase-like enzyme
MLLAVFLSVPPGAMAEFSVSSSDGLVTLDNGENIRAVVAPRHGGELSGFAVKIDGRWRELIYRAMDYSDHPGWVGKSPFLWPAPGVSWTQQDGRHHWVLDGVTREMPAHGFARRLQWTITEQEITDSKASVTLQMTGMENWRDHYPFDYNLEVEYRLFADRLQLIYSVAASAANTGPMPFSIGNHVTFKAPMLDIGEAGDVRFHSDYPDQMLREETGNFAGRIIPTKYPGWQPVSALPHRYAVSLGGTSGKAELLVEDPSGLWLKLSHQASSEPQDPVIRFNLWADTEEGFFSPEPWLATQNSLNTGAGLVRLEPGRNWNWQIDITPGFSAVPKTATEQE